MELIKIYYKIQNYCLRNPLDLISKRQVSDGSGGGHFFVTHIHTHTPPLYIYHHDNHEHHHDHSHHDSENMMKSEG